MNDPCARSDADPDHPGPNLQVFAEVGQYFPDRMQPVGPDQPLTEEQKKTRRVYHTRAVTSSLLLEDVACPKKLPLEVPVRPLLVTTVVLSHTPAILESVDGRRTETGLTEHLDVTVTGDRTGDVTNLRIHCRANSATILAPGWSAKDAQVATDSPVEVSDATWSGKPALRLAVSKGRHRIALTPKEGR
jgi:hypothetical protein